MAVGPLVLVSVFAWKLNEALGTPPTFRLAFVRWVILVVVATAALRWLDLIVRRFLPLAILLKMTLSFPEEVPSRFRIAMRRGSTRQLRRDLDAGTLDVRTPQEAAERLLSMVARLSDHDATTRGHIERVRAYADLIGDELAISEDERQKLHWAALIHDIGKMRIPDWILNKSGQPDEDELAILRTHPEHGWRLVEPLRD